MPSEPGDYEIRYTLRQDGEIIATRPISVVAPQISLQAPDTAVAGSVVTVEWNGPDYDLDFISVAEAGAGNYDDYTYTSEGNPLQLEMPTTPGNYEIRYQLRQNEQVLASRPISITAVKASIAAPVSANVGETLMLGWDGPDYELDFISVGLAGEVSYINYSYTSEGSPLALQMPPTQGDYEIRYQLRQDSEIVFRQPISITPIMAELIAPDSIALGDELIVGWDGPDYVRDFIGIAKTGEDGYASYAYTDNGNPLTIQLPDTPGEYELRYYMEQDSTIIGTRPLTVTE